MSEVIKILLADDHQVIRDGIRSFLEGNDRFQIVAEASNGKQVLARLEKTEVDAIIMDIRMDVMDGITCTKEVSKLYPDIKVLVLSMYNEPQYIKSIMASGASGYLLKNSGQEEVIRGIESVVSGEKFYSAEVTNTVMNSLGGKKSRSFSDMEIPLTEREKEVLELIVQEFSNQEIADKLFISPRTVDAHKRNLLEKTGAKNMAGLVKYAIRHQLFDSI
ncbi:response regulator transcription factor [Flammeovirgaceae bacterium SG7u.111]|nr:response regulator transcription factor [Flammeovirgaceae bacterium SG7u.132]WPO38361.1 response regulator transcription factor [Flammeovirgaceae bacterium SG7u.111]